jgi:MFS family permease
MWTVILSRLIYGILIGLNSAINPQYINKFSPIALSGIFGSFSGLFLLLGLTIAFVLSWIFLRVDPAYFDSSLDYGIFGFNSWRVIFGFPAVTCILRGGLLILVYRDNLP